MHSILKWVIIGLFIILGGGIIYMYKSYNPGAHSYFPVCPFHALTGLKCPGCGSQRAIHFLLNFDIINAAKQNILFVAAIPYLLLGFTFEYFPFKYINKERYPKLNHYLYSGMNVKIIFVLIILFWILRNII